MTPGASTFPDHAAGLRVRLWADLVARNAYRSIAEIGVWKGDFARVVLTACPEISTNWMIDPWRWLPNWNKPFDVTDEQFDTVYRDALAATESHSAVRRAAERPPR
jgi:hypothetical protein